MKKITTLILALLAVAGTAKAGEYVVYQPTAPLAISWDTSKYTGVQFDSNDDAYKAAVNFATLSKDDVIKIHVTNVGNDMSYELDYKVGDSWAWTKLESGVSYADGVITYTVATDDIATLIKQRGLVVKGIYFKMLDITVSSTNVADDGSYNFRTIVSTSTDLGTDWSPSVDLRYCDYSDVAEGDILRIDYTASGSDSQIQLQKNWSKYNDDTDKGSLSGTGSLDFTITSEMLTIMQETGDARNDNFALKGKNATITSVSIRKTLTKAGYRPVYIPAGGYATFFGASTLALPTGVTAYYVSATTDDTATLTSISNIPANEGVILQGTTGIYQLYTTDETAATVSGNKLSGSTSRQQITDATNKYVLYDNSGTAEFRKITANTYLDAYKCYLTTSSSAPTLNVTFDEGNGTTAISTVETRTEPTDGRTYNLQGQEVKVAKGGIFIKNGKKYIVK